MFRDTVYAVLPALALLSSLASPAAAADDPGGSLAASLARLRGEVETLAGGIELERADQQARMRSLAAQNGELEVQIKREELRLKQLSARTAEHQAKVAAVDQQRQELRPAVLRLAAMVDRAIASTLPFQREERRNEIKQLLARYNEDLLQVDAAIAQLWALCEDELRLGRESGIYQQILTLDGAEHLVEVARVGMVMLFFRTRDDRFGLLRRDGGSWKPELVAGKEDSRAVAALFDSFRKQVRTGLFRLPNPWRSEGNRSPAGAR